MYLENSDVEVLSQPVECFSDTGVRRVGNKNNIAFFPG